jgi:hypothetical protein
MGEAKRRREAGHDRSRYSIRMEAERMREEAEAQARWDALSDEEKQAVLERRRKGQLAMQALRQVAMMGGLR